MINDIQPHPPSQAEHSKPLARKVGIEEGGRGVPLLILCAAFIATLPLILQGCSCGHDFDFHLQSWLDAAQQFRQGTFQPHWAFSAAYNAGEPRFLFYPPLSWMLGAILTLIFPIAATPAIYTFLALAAAGLAMRRLARHFAPPTASLIAATLYIVNPYILFTAYERTAYAELLAAAWLPLLFLAALRSRPTIRGLALPIALLWLTNAPAAVMGCYTLALIITTRIVLQFIMPTQICHPERRLAALGEPQSKDLPDLQPRQAPRTLSTTAPALRLAATSIAGTALGLALPTFYLIPAAYERRFVQIAMAIIPNMRFQDNFLFGHTADAPHNVVLHTASLIALTLLAATAAALLALFLLPAKPSEPSAPHPGRTILVLLTAAIAALLTPFSTPLWNHLPELAFLQFPWRLLAILGVVFALAIASRLRSLPQRPTIAVPLTVILAALVTTISIHNFRQPCDDTDTPTARAQFFQTHHGVEPTDEYTPAQADNDVLRSNDPAFWLSTDPAAFAPNTTPNPAATDPNYNDTPDPDQTLSTPAPNHLTLNLAQPQTLILNLRDYPDWTVTRTTRNATSPEHPDHIPRDDGLIAIPLPAGRSTIDIRWRRTLDQQLGLALSAIAAAVYAALLLRARSRRIEGRTA